MSGADDTALLAWLVHEGHIPGLRRHTNGRWSFEYDDDAPVVYGRSWRAVMLSAQTASRTLATEDHA